jgi:hypothetical protein
LHSPISCVFKGEKSVSLKEVEGQENKEGKEEEEEEEEKNWVSYRYY